jgi:peptidoglycan/xylan/chitin deacetylase (PgdA/CDA1 family)
MKFLISLFIRNIFLYLTYILPAYSFGRNKLRVIMYHGIGDDTISSREFEEHLIFYKKHFQIYWASEAIGLLNNNFQTTTNKQPLILTFDDGLKNNFSKAAPILEKLNVKATFYLVSDLLSGNKMLWNHEIRCRLELLSKSDLDALSITIPDLQKYSSESKKLCIEKYVNTMKSWSKSDQIVFLEKLRCYSLSPNYTESMLNEFLVMSIDNVKALPDCIEIGSHGETHALLDTISLEDASNEICRSKIKLEKILGTKVKTFCYPNGNMTPEIISIVQGEYESAVTVVDGFVLKEDSPMEFKRIPATPKLQNLAYRLIRPAS